MLFLIRNILNADYMKDFEALKEIVLSLESEVQKFKKNNKSAGARVRKGMQEVKKLAQSIRTYILQCNKSDGTSLPE